MASPLQCCICNTSAPQARTATVRCNVRAHADQRFTLWRCPACRSIHALEEVDLDHYYREYPFLGQEPGWALWCTQHTLMRRLRRAGLKPGMSLLDFGCGSGLLAAFLREHGFRAVGYDPFSETHNDASLLNRRYDALLAQDVLEHSETPLAMLDQFASLVRPGGRVFLGTPNAAGIHLDHPERFVHALHQPYHRHLFSPEALIDTTAPLGWRLRKLYNTPYTNMPLLSLPMLHHYMAQADGTLDALFGQKFRWRFWLRPKTYWLLALGYWLCDEADMLAVFDV